MPKKGYKQTEEHRTKLSDAKLKNPTRFWLGKKRPTLWNGNRPELIGIKLSTIHKKKISKTNKIRMQTITHHINGVHEDDRPENKMKMTQSKHIKLHYKQGDMPQLGIGRSKLQSTIN